MRRVRRVVDLSHPLDDSTQVFPGDPAVSLASVATVARHGFNLLAVRMGDGGAAAFPAHRAVLGAGGVIVENLTNLSAVDFPEPLVSVLPIRLTGGDGAPVRAVAMELGS